MLSVQTFSVCCLFMWGLIATYPILWLVNKVTPIRLSPQDEAAGCDVVEHFMGDEKEIIPLNCVQPNNIKFGIPHGNFQISDSTLSSCNDSYREFDTLNKRKPYFVNVGSEQDNTHPSERL